MLRYQPCGIYAATDIPSGPLLFSFCRVMDSMKQWLFSLCKNNKWEERKYWHTEKDKEGRKYIKNIKEN